jgi:hypothetical protein
MCMGICGMAYVYAYGVYVLCVWYVPCRAYVLCVWYVPYCMYVLCVCLCMCALCVGYAPYSVYIPLVRYVHILYCVTLFVFIR